MVWHDEWESMRLYAMVWDSSAMVWHSNAMLWDFNDMLCYDVYSKRYALTYCKHKIYSEMKYMYVLNSRVQELSSAFQKCPLQQEVLFPLNIKLHILQK